MKKGKKRKNKKQAHCFLLIRFDFREDPGSEKGAYYPPEYYQGEKDCGCEQWGMDWRKALAFNSANDVHQFASRLEIDNTEWRVVRLP